MKSSLPAAQMRAGDTPLIDAARNGRAADVTALLAGGADVDEPKTDGCGATALYVACQEGHTEVVTKLLAANADVNHTNLDGAIPLYIACENGHTEIVTKLLAANADIEKADNDGCTPLFIACCQGHTEIVTKLLAANASVDQPRHNGGTPMIIACAEGHLGCVQLLSSYGASRNFRFVAPTDTAEHLASNRGHHELVAWLVRTRLWSTPLHHLEVLTPERARALLRAGADLHAAAEPGGPTPLSLAQAAAAAGGAAEGTAAFLVLEAAKPWSRKTHKYFPEPARERAAELLRVGQWFKRLPNDFPIQFEVWETFVMPHAVHRYFTSTRREKEILSGAVRFDDEGNIYDDEGFPVGAKIY